MDDFRRGFERGIERAVGKAGDLFHGKPSDEDIRLARQLHQAQRDSREDAMARLVESHPSLGELIWRMQDEARKLRRKAGTYLYHRDRKPIVPDCDSPQFAYGPQSVVEAACQQLGFTGHMMVAATPANGYLSLLEDLGQQDRGYPYHAIIQPYSGHRPPTLVANLASPKVLWTVSNGGDLDGRVVEVYHWVFQMASVLGRLYRDFSYFFGDEVVITGPVTPDDPWRDPALTVQSHMFAKTLLGLGTDCPRDSCCRCNEILGRLRQVPPSHPNATGVSLMPFGRPRYHTSSGPRPTPFTPPPPPLTPPPPPPESPYQPRPQRPTTPPPSQAIRPTSPPPPQSRPSHPSQPSTPTPPPERLTPPPPPPAEQRHYPTLADNPPPGTRLRQYNDEHRHGQENGNGNGNGYHHSDEYPTVLELGPLTPPPPAQSRSQSRKLSEDDLVTGLPTVELEDDDGPSPWEEAEARDLRGDGEGENSNPGTPVVSGRRPKR